MTEYAPKLAQAVDGYLHSQNWKYDFDKENGIFKFGMNLGNKMKSCDVRILIGDDSVSIYTISPIAADPQDREGLELVNEYITRANYNLRIGNFELDHRDGELRYKSTMFCGDMIPTLAVLEHIVDIGFLMWKRYGDGLLAVLFGNAVPAQEIGRIED
jgi:hypothetical protein